MWTGLQLVVCQYEVSQTLPAAELSRHKPGLASLPCDVSVIFLIQRCISADLLARFPVTLGRFNLEHGQIAEVVASDQEVDV